MAMLQNIGDGIWTAALALRMPGLDIGTRTTIVRLPSGGSLVHSPGALTPELKAEVDALGAVEHVVAPNRFHHLFVRAWKDAYPEAIVHAAPGLQEKRKSFPFDAVLGDAPHDAWKGVLEQHLVKGAPMMSEVVFCHPASRTLVAADLAMNIQRAPGFGTRVFWTVNGAWKRFGPTRMVRFTFKDKPAVKRSIDHILGWDFDRLLIAHGESLETGGREALREAYARV